MNTQPKTAREYWKEKFDEYPQNDAEKLALAMMAGYATDCVIPFYTTPPTAQEGVSKENLWEDEAEVRYPVKKHRTPENSPYKGSKETFKHGCRFGYALSLPTTTSKAEGEVCKEDMTAKEYFTGEGSPLTLDNICTPVERDFLLEQIELYAKGKVRCAAKLLRKI